jgi:hypothetical protein
VTQTFEREIHHFKCVELNHQRTSARSFQTKVTPGECRNKQRKPLHVTSKSKRRKIRLSMESERAKLHDIKKVRSSLLQWKRRDVLVEGGSVPDQVSQEMQMTRPDKALVTMGCPTGLRAVPLAPLA